MSEKNKEIIYGLLKNAKALPMIVSLILTGAKAEHISEELKDRIKILELIADCIDGKISEPDLARKMDLIDLNGAKRNIKAAEQEGMPKEMMQKLLKAVEEKEQELKDNENDT